MNKTTLQHHFIALIAVEILLLMFTVVSIEGHKQTQELNQIGDELDELYRDTLKLQSDYDELHFDRNNLDAWDELLDPTYNIVQDKGVKDD